MNYLIGFELALANSKNLLKIATLSNKHKQYGIACALNILSAEEAMKSCYLMFRHYFPQIEIPDFDDIFRKHKTKHGNLKWLFAIYKMQVNHFIKLYNKNKESLDGIMQAPRNKDEKHVKRLIQWALREKKDKDGLQEILTWLYNANNQKNNGFYVDRNNSNWLSPQDVSKSRFIKEKKYTQAIQRYIEIMAKDFKKPVFLKSVKKEIELKMQTK